jgi:hypothetical protein
MFFKFAKAHDGVEQRGVDVLPALIPTAGMVRRQAQEHVAVDVDIAAVHVREDVVRFRVAQLPEVGVNADERERDVQHRLV